MTVQLIVLINLQHLRDRRALPLPTLVPVRDWMTSLAAEPGPAVVGTVSMPTSILPSRSPPLWHWWTTTSTVGATSRSVPRRPSSTTAGVGKRTHCRRTIWNCRNSPAAARVEVGPRPSPRQTDAAPWTAPSPRGGSFRPVPSRRKENTGHPDRRVPDHLPRRHRVRHRNLSGAEDMRRLDAGILAQALPAALASAGEGSDLVRLGEHWMTPCTPGWRCGCCSSCRRAWRRALCGNGSGP